MSALGETEARADSIRKLRTVVSAMRGIAATHLQQARAGLAGYRAYARVVADGLGRGLQLLASEAPPFQARSGPRACVVFSAEHGFAGAFAAKVIEAAATGGDSELMVVGSRGQALAAQRGLSLAWSAPMASQAAGVPAIARHVADQLYAALAEGRLAQVDLVYACLGGGGGAAAVVRKTVLPVDPAEFALPAAGAPPLTNLSPRRLVEQLVGEYVFAALALAALESFASENAARLETMQSARLNIDQKLDELAGLERLLRQEQITAEVQDVVAGALAADGRRA